jgi:hypothetical protein
MDDVAGERMEGRIIHRNKFFGLFWPLVLTAAGARAMTSKVRNSRSAPLVQGVEATRASDGSITVSGVATLPAGTKLMIELLGRAGRTADQAESRVGSGGRFSATGLSNGSRPWAAGSYQVRILSYFTRVWQSESILASVGVNGARLPQDALVPDDPEFPKASRHLEVKVTVVFPDVSRQVAAIQAVQGARLLVAGQGKSSASVKETVDRIARAPGFRPLNWTAAQRGDGSWIVSLACIDGQQHKEAQWSYNPQTGRVKYLDPLSKILSYLPPE